MMSGQCQRLRACNYRFLAMALRVIETARRWCQEAAVRLTGDASSQAEVDGIPDHGPIGDWQQGLGVLVWV